MGSNESLPRCLNCGAELSGPFCSQCGQEDTELRVSLKRLFRDFLAEQAGLETKVPTTLWKLVSRPIKYMPNAIFLLLPVFAFLLYLLYRKSGRFFAEHLIFALHIHAFSFVALIFALVLPDALDIIVPVWILVYLFIALRKVYSESRRRTALKFSVLLFTYMITLQVTLLALLGIIFAVG